MPSEDGWPIANCVCRAKWSRRYWGGLAPSGHASLNNVAGYVGLGRRFGPVTVFGLASGIKSLTQPAETPAWGAALAPVLGPANAQQAQLLGEAGAFAANRSGVNQRSLSLGVRWDVLPQIALKVQWESFPTRCEPGAGLVIPTRNEPGRGREGRLSG